jgi:hypothetical protein
MGPEVLSQPIDARGQRQVVQDRSRFSIFGLADASVRDFRPPGARVRSRCGLRRGSFCLIPAVFLLGSPIAAIGLACLVFMALLVWLLMRPIRLEITGTEVRAKQAV